MRFTKPVWQEGDTRVIKRFAFLPITIYRSVIKDSRHHDETRWLEHVTILQKYSPAIPYVQARWINYKFIDKEDEEEKLYPTE